MKKFIYFIAFTTLLSTLTSCTADEIPTKKEKNSTQQLNKDGDPPVIIIKP